MTSKNRGERDDQFQPGETVPLRIMTVLMTAACVLLALSLVLASRQTPSPAGNAADAPASQPAGGDSSSEKFSLLLSRQVGDIQFDDVTLEEALNLVSDRAEVSLIVHWADLRNAGIDRTTKVKLHIYNATLQRALSTLLASIEHGEQAGFTLQEDAILVGTREDIARHLITVVYNVRDILMGAEKTGTGWRDSLDLLERTIGNQVEPDSWRDAGGPNGDMRDLMGLLIIGQTADNHIQIAKILQKIRDADMKLPFTGTDKPLTPATAPVVPDYRPIPATGSTRR